MAMAMPSSSHASPGVGSRKWCRSPSLEREEFGKIQVRPRSVCGFLDLPLEAILELGQYLDSQTLLNLMATCKTTYHMLKPTNSFWKDICQKREFGREYLNPDNKSLAAIGSKGKVPTKIHRPRDSPFWRRVYDNGLFMYRNISKNKFRGWRLLFDNSVPMKLSSDINHKTIEEQMESIQKLEPRNVRTTFLEDGFFAVHLLHVISPPPGVATNSTLMIWDVREDPPKLLMDANLPTALIGLQIAFVDNYVVIVPLCPAWAGLIVAAMNIHTGLEELSFYHDSHREEQFKLSRGSAMWALVKERREVVLVCQFPDWTMIVLSIPDCKVLWEMSLSQVPKTCTGFIRFLNCTGCVVLQSEQEDFCLITAFHCLGKDTTILWKRQSKDLINDVQISSERGEVFVLKRNGIVVALDRFGGRDTVKFDTYEDVVPLLDNQWPWLNNKPFFHFCKNDHILYVIKPMTRKDTCFVWVYVHFGDQKTLEYVLDLKRYGPSKTVTVRASQGNSVILMVANGQKCALFHLKTGQQLGQIKLFKNHNKATRPVDKPCVKDLLFLRGKLFVLPNGQNQLPIAADIYIW